MNWQKQVPETVLKTKQLIHNLLILSVVSVQVFFYPSLSFAEGEVAPSANDSQSIVTPVQEPVPTVTPAPQPDTSSTPVQAEPVETTTTVSIVAPATPPPPAPAPEAYTFNETTGLWDSSKWQYSPTSGTYEPVVPPVVPSPATPPQTLEDAQTASSPLNSTSLQAAAQGTSNPAIGSTSNLSTALSGTNNTNVSNTLNSTGLSGNALGVGNLVVGNAASGSSNSINNIVNMLQSSWGSPSSPVTTFNTTLQGNVVGDILIDPSNILPPIPVANQTNATSDLKLAAYEDVNLANTVNVDATSGNAQLGQNTVSGTASTGDANAVANVMNLLNSTVAAGQSFVGVLNIEGSLLGNIFLPNGFLNSILGSGGNSAPGSSQTKTTETSSTSNASFNNDLAIRNTVNLDASSGTARAIGNSEINGPVGTGNSATNLNIFDMIGRQIVAKNAMLVFVNVLGSWKGLIVDAPTGSTSALYGGSVSGDTSKSLQSNTSIDQAQKALITNDINVRAKSGDALASYNTVSGGARSGNATASANVANFSNSQFGLSNWFGVLFINVFGEWQGNFVPSKPLAATLPTLPSATGAGDSKTLGSTVANSPPAVFSFVPKKNPVKALRTYYQPGNLSYTSEQTQDNADDINLASAKITPESKKSLPRLDTYTATASDQKSNQIISKKYAGLLVLSLLMGGLAIKNDRKKSVL
jgi:hypothetical protein